MSEVLKPIKTGAEYTLVAAGVGALAALALKNEKVADAIDASIVWAVETIEHFKEEDMWA